MQTTTAAKKCLSSICCHDGSAVELSNAAYYICTVPLDPQWKNMLRCPQWELRSTDKLALHPISRQGYQWCNVPSWHGLSIYNFVYTCHTWHVAAHVCATHEPLHATHINF